MNQEVNISTALATILMRPSLLASTKVDLIQCELQEHCELFEPLLTPYRKDLIRGVIEEESIKIAEDSLTIKDNLTGAISFEFDEVAHYGCRDKNEIYEHCEEVEFTVDADREIIIFHGMDEPEFDPEEL